MVDRSRMQHMLLVVVLSGLWPFLAANYSDSVLVKVEVDNQAHLRSLVGFLESEELREDVDLWSISHILSRPVTFTVTRPMWPAVETWLSGHGLEYTLDTDLQGLVKEAEDLEHSRRSSRRTSELDLGVYNDHEQMNNFLYATEENCDVCDTIRIGQSYEGRDMVVLRVGRLGRRKPAIWIDSGIHAREWISPAVALQVIDKLVRGYQEQDEDVVWMLDNFVWYILPSANPDGYMYSREQDRFWRKTRSPTNRPGCIGTDPNRNWRADWAGASSDSCSESYRGSAPFSEVETRNIKNFLYRRRRHFLVYLSYHAYGQMWMYPYGYNSSLPSDWEEIHRVGERVVNKLREVSGEEYALGSIAHVIYEASGSSIDWTKDVAGIKYGFGVELPDRGQHGFLLPSSEIQATSDGQWVALQEMSRAVREYVDEVLSNN